jgi:hypothetical protein
LKGIVKEFEFITDIVLIKSADIMKIGEAVAAKGYSIASWSCGTDRIESYRKMCSKYAPEVDIIEIHREDSDVSATQVRNYIKNDKEEQFKELTPKSIHKYYKVFRDTLEAL